MYMRQSGGGVGHSTHSTPDSNAEEDVLMEEDVDWEELPDENGVGTDMVADEMDMEDLESDENDESDEEGSGEDDEEDSDLGPDDGESDDEDDGSSW
jgi:hypothetical protein